MVDLNHDGRESSSRSDPSSLQFLDRLANDEPRVLGTPVALQHTDTEENSAWSNQARFLTGSKVRFLDELEFGDFVHDFTVLRHGDQMVAKLDCALGSKYVTRKFPDST